MAHSRDGSTKEQLLDAAVRLFGNEGYEGTSLDDVASAVGVRKQSLLYYFPSKADLFAAAAAEAAQQVYVALDTALQRHDPGGLDRLPLFIDAATELADRRPEVLALIREVARAGPPVSDRVVEALKPLVDSATAWMERGMSDGVIRKQDARLALLTIYSAVIGHLTDSSVQRALIDDCTRSQVSDELVAFLRAALAPA